MFSSANLLDHQIGLTSIKGKIIDKVSTKNALATLENLLPYFSKKKLEEFSITRFDEFSEAL